MLECLNVGIADFDGCAISAGGLYVNRKYEAFDVEITKRKYIGD